MNKVLIDSSVWISFFRGRDQGLIEAVSSLLTRGAAIICGVVVTEVIQGALNEKEMEKILTLFEPVERIDLTLRDWEVAGRLSYSLRRKGITASTLDVLLATTAIENDCFFYTADKHFELITRHSDLKLYLPSST